MKKILVILGVVIVLVVAGIGGLAIAVNTRGIPTYEPGNVQLTVEATPEKVERGRKLATTLCVGCHLDPQTGQLTGKHMDDAPAEFGVIYSRNITQDEEYGIGEWTDGELAYLFRTGVTRDGRYIPPYMPKLAIMSDQDIESIIAFLRSDDPLVQPVAAPPPGTTEPSFLTKMLANTVFKPLPYPEDPIPHPDGSDPVEYGRYLVTGAYDCWGCHSADFKTLNLTEPEASPGFLGGGNLLIRLDGGAIFSANLTMHETGLAGWSQEDFDRTLRTGFRPDGTIVGYPMLPMPQLTDEETAAMWAYLQTVPKIDNPVPPPNPPLKKGDPGDPGQVAYYTYGCNHCHGNDGVGLADLRNANEHYPEDEDLEAWIRNAPSIKPNTRMPMWDGVIAEDDYAPLIQYVRSLSDAG